MALMEKHSPVNTDPRILYTVPPELSGAFLKVSAVNRVQSVEPKVSIAIVAENDLAVASITVDNPGGNLQAMPSVSLSGGSPKTPAAISVASLQLTSVSIANAGTGYAVGNNITITPVAGVTVMLRVDSVGGTGNITGVSLVTTGTFASVPANPATALAATNVSGSGANAQFNQCKFGIKAFNIVSAGNGYKSVPAVAVSGLTGGSFTVNMTQIAEDDDWIEYDVALPYGDAPLVRDIPHLKTGQSIIIKSSEPNAVNFHVVGLPQAL